MKVSYGVVAVFVVDLLATSGDVALSWTSPILPKLHSNDTEINPLGRPITNDEDALLGSLLNILAAVGSFPFSFLADKLGRRIALMAVAIPYIISYFTLAFSRDIYSFYFARIIGGLAIGGGYALLPMYIAEISKDANRGAMSQTLNVFWAIGNFIPYALGPFISIFWFNIVLACIPTCFLIIFFFMGPESPCYLIECNKLEKAEEVLMKLRSRSKDEVQKELCEIKTHLRHDHDEKGASLEIFTNRVLFKIFIMCLILVLTQELSGFCAIMYHLEMIFDVTGTKLDASISALIVGLASLLSSLVSPLLVDRAGRRFLIITSCIGMCIALGLLSFFFYALDQSLSQIKFISWIPMFSLTLYIFSFNFGICCVPWTLTSELFPNNVKHVAASIITSATWVVSFFTTSFYHTINNYIGLSGTFCLYSLFCLFTAIYSTLVVPETKGKSFFEIQEMLKYGKINDSKDEKILLQELRT